MPEYQYETTPFEHQDELFTETRAMEAYAVLWEQGCAKTKPMIDTCAFLWESEEIDAMIVVAPPGVERNWLTDELPTHMPKRHWSSIKTMLWRTPKSRTKWHQAEFDRLVRHEGLAIFLISYQGFMSEFGKKAVWRFLRRRRCLYVLDESDDIKTPNAKRTKSVVASGVYAPYRRIMTGTPADKPFDIYSQLKFIEPDIWKRRGMENYFSFKQHFGVWRTRAQAQEELGYDPGYDMLLDYKNIEELNAILASVSSRLLKEDVLDLPDKLYTKIWFEMTPKQQAYYDELRERLEIELEDGRVVDGNLAITRLLRLQQITCGYMVTDDDEEPVELCDTKNPRLDATVAALERCTHQAIIWARFRMDVDLLMDALGKRGAVRYDGAVSDDECELAKEAFNAGDAQFFVATQSKASRGLTMNGAKSAYYYSNSFKLRDRLQSEDRCHRAGQEGIAHEGHGHGVLYSDVLAADTVDMKIVENLRGKFDIAAQITGDVLRQWI